MSSSQPTQAPGRTAAGEAPEALLARAARAGDRGAFAGLYERLAPAVHGVLLAHANETDVRDLLQDVFLKALKSIRTLDDPARVGAWLFAIARNRARDLARRPRPRALETFEEPAAEPAPDAEGDAEESRRALEAIRSLPEAYRETLVLRLVEGLTGPEIAAHTGLTHGSVRVNLHRGMKLLRERLEQGGAA